MTLFQYSPPMHLRKTTWINDRQEVTGSWCGMPATSMASSTRFTDCEECKRLYEEWMHAQNVILHIKYRQR